MLFLKPVYKTTVWGSSAVKEMGYDCYEDNVGEVYIASGIKNSSNQILNGEFTGQVLSELFVQKPELFLNQKLYSKINQFPILLKIICAKTNLSIQVHPDNVYAAKNENDRGKFECWYILDCKEDAQIIFGHNAKTNQEAYKLIDSGQWNKLIRHLPIQKGDCFEVTPGTIHAICENTVLYEIQEPSMITYRLYDYDRLENGKKRELHLKQAKDVIYSPQKKDKIKPNGNVKLKNDYFTVSELKVNNKHLINLTNNDSFIIITCIEGVGFINNHPFAKSDTIILLIGQKYELKGDLKLIVAELNKESLRN